MNYINMETLHKLPLNRVNDMCNFRRLGSLVFRAFSRLRRASCSFFLRSWKRVVTAVTRGWFFWKKLAAPLLAFAFPPRNPRCPAMERLQNTNLLFLLLVLGYPMQLCRWHAGTGKYISKKLQAKGETPIWWNEMSIATIQLKTTRNKHETAQGKHIEPS